MKWFSIFDLVICSAVVMGCFGLQKNVLFLSVDDLRPELGAYIDDTTSPPLFSGMRTPNIDRLAAKSLVLNKAFVQLPLCAPSRASILTGRRPNTTKVFGFHQNFRKLGGNFTTIPGFFKEHGYKTVGYGKIFHDGPESWNDDQQSWSEPFTRVNKTIENMKQSWRAVPDSLLTETPLRDTLVANHAIKALKKLATEAKSGKQPFFLAAGFYKPHLPFVFPESMLQYYPKESIYLPKNMYMPKNMPEVTWASCAFLKKFPDVIALNATLDYNTSLPDWKVLELRRAYYSAVTFVDIQIGRVLDEVERLGLRSNTIIVFWSDHGFHLGENLQWCKSTPFEMSTWAPLILHIPGRTDTGIRTNQLVEFVDLFPSLVDAVGFQPPPLCPQNSKKVRLCVEGYSFLRLIDNPSKPIKNSVFSQVFRPDRTVVYTMRTDNYRYSEYQTFDPTFKSRVKKVLEVELYDLSRDPWENYNVAKNRKYSDVIKMLSKQLKSGWRESIIPEYDSVEPPIQKEVNPITSDAVPEHDSVEPPIQKEVNPITTDAVSVERPLTNEVNTYSHNDIDTFQEKPDLKQYNENVTNCSYCSEILTVFSFIVILYLYHVYLRNKKCNIFSNRNRN